MRPKERQEITICREEAKLRTKTNGKTYMQNLHSIAKELGFSSWDGLIHTCKTEKKCQD